MQDTKDLFEVVVKQLSCTYISDIKFTEKTKALKQKRKEMEYSYMINLFSHKKVELIINCVNMLFILFLIKSLGENIFVLMFQLIWSVILLMELFIYIYYIPILTFIKTEFVRSKIGSTLCT